MRVGDLIHDFKFNKMLGKGQIGQIVEEELFGYKNNSKKEADFSNLGVELKVTGLIERKNKSLAMKERLVLNIINYYEEANVEFLNSSFWKKPISSRALWKPEVRMPETLPSRNSMESILS